MSGENRKYTDEELAALGEHIQETWREDQRLAAKSTRQEIEQDIDRVARDFFGCIREDDNLWILTCDILEFKRPWRRLNFYQQTAAETDMSVFTFQAYIDVRQICEDIISDRYYPNAGLPFPDEAKRRAQQFLDILSSFSYDLIKEAWRTFNNKPSSLNSIF